MPNVAYQKNIFSDYLSNNNYAKCRSFEMFLENKSDATFYVERKIKTTFCLSFF